MAKPRIAILASGSGTTAEAVAGDVVSGRLDAEIGLIVYNNPNAGIIRQPTILELGIGSICINGSTHPASGESLVKGEMTDAESAAVVEALKEARIDVVVLLGFMKKIRGALMEEFGFDASVHSLATDSRMLNTHPGPLPQTIGLHGSGVHEKVFELYNSGELTKTGPTLHAVANEYDTGPVFRFVDSVQITDADTAQTIEDRVREVERAQTGAGIQKFLEDVEL